MRLIFCSRYIPANYQTNLIVDLSALKQVTSCSISSESAWSNYARTETFVIIRHRTNPLTPPPPTPRATQTHTQTHPCASRVETWKLCLWNTKEYKCFRWSWRRGKPQRGEVKCHRAGNVNGTLTLGLPLMGFWGEDKASLVSSLSSPTGPWGVIWKYGSVMNLFAFSKPLAVT